MSLVINQMFAFVTIDAADGNEAVIGAIGQDGMWRPFVGADMARVADLKEIVETLPMFAGRKIVIVRFGEREEIGTIDRRDETS